ncbi:hypothetical protein C9374_007050 [Naegleria lovaniensis]|uniref:Glutathione S-transferase n=1 Tax=Naegleria lovaniensis TaxID=51637 RepID=A0AA88KSB6_NAELO|nr:uncharacterized protein C9374_007050 [Naegleria lovaniensis]KAG2393519.1 hypothetical protein C9374_007050 [Naegleria lovaniensis]
MVYELTYFNIPGRAEAIKLIAEVGGVEYNFKPVTFQEWPQVKQHTKYGQLPFLKSSENQDFELCQSIAIARFIAREGNLYPSSNVDASFSDEYVNTIKDLNDAYFKAFFSPNKDEDLKKYYEGPFGQILKALEKEVKPSGFLVGDSLTWADLFLFDLLSGIGKGQDLSAYPKLAALKETVAKNPKVAQYYESDRNLRK